MFLAPSVSVIIPTFNRPEALRRTLESLAKVRVLDAGKIEVIVVDNASTDHVATLARSVKFQNVELIVLNEPEQGKCKALNTALARARGEFILFTDDDVIVPEDWVEQMVCALRSGDSGAVVGQITLAPELRVTWLTQKQKWLLAVPDDNSLESPQLIGANMGIRRAVLQRVPAFDPELGPGALGLGEEELFGLQLVEAGYAVKTALRSVVVHCPEASRLTRAHWLAAAQKSGRTIAYINYHWKHAGLKICTLDLGLALVEAGDQKVAAVPLAFRKRRLHGLGAQLRDPD